MIGRKKVTFLLGKKEEPEYERENPDFAARWSVLRELKRVSSWL